MRCAALFLLGLMTIAAGLSAVENPFVGTWTSNFSKSKVPSNYQYKRVTLQFAVVFDTVTIGSKLVTASGHEQGATELFHADGKEHPGTLSPGVLHMARWVNSRILETRAK